MNKHEPLHKGPDTLHGYPLDEILTTIELPGVYDGWSILVLKNGNMINRWAGGDGRPLEGYERRWQATETYIATYEAPDEPTG